MSNNILILSKNAADYMRLLRDADLPGASLFGTEDGPLDGCEIVFGEPDRIRALLGRLPALRWAQSTWAGVEPLLDPSLPRGYRLTNARGVFGGLMVEFITAYLLLHERKVLRRLEAQRERRWDPEITGTLRGKTIGLLGVGSIGAEVARAAKFFGMRVRGYTRSSEGCPHVDEYFRDSRLEEFAAGLDYLVNILPNTPATRAIVSSNLLARLPAHALVINVGRGAAVDESALEYALRRGAIAGAVLDVFDEEPLPPAHPFWTTPNLIITSHTAAPSIPADIARLFVENYRRYAAGQPLLYEVDFERGY